MNLKKKKALSAKTLGVGKNKIVFVKSRIDEIKEAITKQDIRDLFSEGAIIVKPAEGRRKSTKIRKRRSVGNVRKKIKERKRKYIIMTRKLRRHLADVGNKVEFNTEQTKEIRKKIKNKEFKNKAGFADYLKTFNTK
ncbi:MAG: 50S ribosomal protein L19e [Candidatus Pacearchaeota archaeon]